MTLLLAVGAVVSAIATIANQLNLTLGIPVASFLAALAAALTQLERLRDLLGLNEPEPSDPQTGSGADDHRTRRARRELLDEVRRHWVDSELENSLHELARIELGLASRPSAVDSPLRAMIRLPDEPDQPLAQGIRIGAVYRQLGRQLLILGEPGAGKTTLLLELTRELLQDAEADPTARTPVVFHLSTWATAPGPLASWLVEELNKRYGVARPLGRLWVEADQIIPLLDGLDEVAPQHRPACLATINAFHEAHGQVPIVVSTRSGEYEALPSTLTLRGAIVIQPLTRTQVELYLAAAGEQLAGVTEAVREDERLYELLTTPLFLSIVALTYRGRPDVAVRISGTLEERRRRVMADYVEAVLQRPTATPDRFARDRVVAGLAWLAGAMRARDQSVFYPDLVQPDLLPAQAQRRLVTIGVAAAVAVGGGLVGGLLVSLDSVPINWLTTGLGMGVGIGLAVYDPTIAPTERLRWSWTAMRRHVGSWLTFGLTYGPGIGLGFGLGVEMALKLPSALSDPASDLAASSDGLLYSLGASVVGLGFGCVIALVGGFSSGIDVRPYVNPPAPGTAMRRSWGNGLTGAVLAAAIALVVLAVPPGVGWVVGWAGGGLPVSMMGPLGYAPTVVFLGGIAGLIAALIAAHIRDIPRPSAILGRGVATVVPGGIVLGFVVQVTGMRSDAWVTLALL